MSTEERAQRVYAALPVLLEEVKALAVAPMTPAAVEKFYELKEVWAGVRTVLREYEDSLARWN